MHAPLLNTLEQALALTWLSGLRALNPASLALRLGLAMLFGGLIGLERERKRRAAGFRTYMLVCMGAALTMLLGQYEAQLLAARNIPGLTADVCRIGAQVINGIGFLGAGTIIVTGRQEVRGLTTAAGLWTSGCMGLAIGAGFYECVLPGFLLILLCIRVFPAIESLVNAKSRNMSLYVEVDSMEGLGELLQQLRELSVRVYDVDLDRSGGGERPNAVLTLRLPGRTPHAQVLAALARTEALRVIEEL